MKRRAFLAAAFSAAAAAGCGFRLFGGFHSFTFIQIADPQIGFLVGGERGDQFSAETKMLETVFSDRIEHAFVPVLPGADIDLVKPAAGAESRALRFVA